MNLCHFDNQMVITYFLVLLCSPLGLCLVDQGLPTKVELITIVINIKNMITIIIIKNVITITINKNIMNINIIIIVIIFLSLGSVAALVHQRAGQPLNWSRTGCQVHLFGEEPRTVQGKSIKNQQSVEEVKI